ncbi:MAG: SDR family NAD(P)-dependent oxidoreductase [Pseudomonadales bacterium]|nr:SDR family NAD(P)-dependent oxidoreductase [Pseudomonadales bacterium]
MENKEQAVIVTGASSGIGLEISRQLLDAGFHVHGVARDFTQSELQHKNFCATEIDMADTEGLPEKMKSLIKTIELPIRALVNNAGIGRMGYLEQLSAADIRQVMAVNFLSHVLVTKAVLPTMKQQSGVSDILFMGSEAGLRGTQQGSIYCASKFAIRGFAQALREECAKSAVKVTLINPGAVRTEFFDELGFEPGDHAENAIVAEDIAELVLSVLSLRAGTVVDEINLSPLKQVWQRKES